MLDQSGGARLGRIARHNVGPKNGARACEIQKPETAMLLPEEWSRYFDEEAKPNSPLVGIPELAISLCSLR